MQPASSLLLASLAAGLLGGCASSPTQLRDASPRAEVASKNPPYAAINCVARKTEEVRSGMVATIREMGEPSRYEAAVRVLEDTVAVIEAAPAAGGSKLTVWMHPRWLDAGRASYLEKVKGC